MTAAYCCLTCGHPRWRPEGHASWCEPHNAREAAFEAVRHVTRSGPRWRKHPSLSAYRSYGCRCADCRALNAEYQRQYRARTASATPDPARESAVAAVGSGIGAAGDVEVTGSASTPAAPNPL